MTDPERPDPTIRPEPPTERPGGEEGSDIDRLIRRTVALHVQKSLDAGDIPRSLPRLQEHLREQLLVGESIYPGYIRRAHDGLARAAGHAQPDTPTPPITQRLRRLCGDYRATLLMAGGTPTQAVQELLGDTRTNDEARTVVQRVDPLSLPLLEQTIADREDAS